MLIKSDRKGVERTKISDQPKTLSILLPVYNEAESLKIMIPVLEAIVDIDHEVLVIYDFPEDNSIETVNTLKHTYTNVNGVFNDFGQGVANAIKKGISMAKGEFVLITVVDEVFPISAIEDMMKLINQGCDFVSGTRYTHGGKRFGGSFVGGILSRLGNKTFRLITGSVLTDATTAMKMFKKSIFEKVTIEAKAGWAFAFEISIKAQLLGLKIGEVPVVSVDRLFGGDSTFRLGAWVREYMKWFIWGVRRLNRMNLTQTKVITLDRKKRKK
ncbi:MAG: glycosyltransferase [Desulfobacterales bacterium]